MPRPLDESYESNSDDDGALRVDAAFAKAYSAREQQRLDARRAAGGDGVLDAGVAQKQRVLEAADGGDRLRLALELVRRQAARLRTSNVCVDASTVLLELSTPPKTTICPHARPAAW